VLKRVNEFREVSRLLNLQQGNITLKLKGAEHSFTPQISPVTNKNIAQISCHLSVHVFMGMCPF
jgi:hypothetical protein